VLYRLTIEASHKSGTKARQTQNPVERVPRTKTRKQPSSCSAQSPSFVRQSQKSDVNVADNSSEVDSGVVQTNYTEPAVE